MKVEEFEAHPLWSTLSQLQGDLNPEVVIEDEGDRLALRRVHTVVEYVDTLRDVSPELVEPEGLANLYTYVQQIQNHLRNYDADPVANQPHLPAAAAVVPEIMSVVRNQFPSPTPDEVTRAAKAAATRYKNSLDEQVKLLIAQVGDLRAAVDHEQAKRAEEATAATARVAALEAQIAASAAEAETQAARLTAQIDAQAATFTTEAAARAAEFAAAQKALNAAEAERLTAVSEDASTKLSEVDAKAKTALKKVTDYEAQAAALVDTTSRHAIAGDYGTWAARQGKAGFLWTLAAVALGVLTMVGMVVAIKFGDTKSIEFTVYKTTISAVGLILAGYAAKQASEHRREERIAKRLALDLAALEPFLEHVTDPEALRTEIAKRVFVPQTEAGSAQETHLRTRRGALSIRELTALLAELKKPLG